MADPGTPSATRERLLDAAERLFAERGIDAVSMREINRAAGARNAVAVQYHFESRDGVLSAVLERHHGAVEAARHTMLDHVGAMTSPSLRDLVAPLVRPLAAQLAGPPGGQYFLRIYAELVNRPRLHVDPHVDRTDSIGRWRRQVDAHLDTPALRQHRALTAIRFTASELGRRATGPHSDNRLFVSHLIDLVAAILAAPVSSETSTLMPRLHRRSVEEATSR